MLVDTGPPFSPQKCVRQGCLHSTSEYESIRPTPTTMELGQFYLGTIFITSLTTLVIYAASLRRLSSPHNQSSLPSSREHGRPIGEGQDTLDLYKRLGLYAVVFIVLIYIANAWLPSNVMHVLAMVYYTAYSAGHLGDLLESLLPAQTATKIMRRLPIPVLKMIAATGDRPL